MPEANRHHEDLIEKIRSLTPEKIAEVEEFVDSLRSRDAGKGLTKAATKLSERAFGRVWNNPEDADYDKL